MTGQSRLVGNPAGRRLDDALPSPPKLRRAFSPPAAAGGTGETSSPSSSFGQGTFLFGVRFPPAAAGGLGAWRENGLPRSHETTGRPAGSSRGKTLLNATRSGSASRAARSSGVPMMSSAYSLSM